MNESTTSDSGFGSTATNDPFQAAKAGAVKAAEELRTAAAQKAAEFRDAATARAQQFKSAAEQKAAEFKEKADEFRTYADDAMGEVRDRYQNVVTEAERLTRLKPRQALLTAFGVGLVVGLLVRR
ncbi:MAG TPA: hypothetical protein VD994_09720 [Prosthecobacter sp.]|nr:hypothetical protein [Prosthecobacter sp.]